MLEPKRELPEPETGDGQRIVRVSVPLRDVIVLVFQVVTGLAIVSAIGAAIAFIVRAFMTQ